MGPRPKFLLKWSGAAAITACAGWYLIFELAAFNYESGSGGGRFYYSPNCEYYVSYRQSLWEAVTDPSPWGISTARLFDSKGKLLFKSKTSPGNGISPNWDAGNNSVSQGDARLWWNYRLPTSPGDDLHRLDCGMIGAERD